MARTRASAPTSAPAAQPARVGGHAAGGGTPEASARHWSARFLLLAAIWGCSFLFIKIGDEAFAPLQVALGRLIFGAGALLVALAARGDRLPRPGRVWGRLAVAALLLNTLPFSLFAYGETCVTSVLAGIWNATTPLLTLAVALLTLPEERPSRERVVGLAVGFAGVLVVLGAWQGFGGRAVLGDLACFGAACCYGLGLPYMRKHLAGRPESALALSAAQLLCGAAELAIVTPVLAAAPTALPPARARVRERCGAGRARDRPRLRPQLRADPRRGRHSRLCRYLRDPAVLDPGRRPRPRRDPDLESARRRPRRHPRRRRFARALARHRPTPGRRTGGGRLTRVRLSTRDARGMTEEEMEILQSTDESFFPQL